MGARAEYRINLDTKYGYSTVIDLPTIVAECRDQWFNQTLCQINDCVLRVGIIQGEFHWHKHDEEDELFWVVEGELLLDIEGADTIRLAPNQGYTVPRGVMHRTRAPERVVMLMVEKASVTPTGD